MFKHCKIISAFLFVALLVSCKKEYIYRDDDFPQAGGNQFPGGDPGGTGHSDTSGDLLETFDIVLDNSELTEQAEVIPSDKNSEDYDDYCENSSFTSRISISFSDKDAVVDGNVTGVKVEKNGAHLIISSTVKGVEYALSGKTSDGSVKIYSDNKFKLTLNGVNITNPLGAAVNIQSKKRVFVVSEKGTENYLTDGSSYKMVDNEDMKGCIFSEGQLVFSGNGRLVVTGNYKHAICSDDYIVIRKGTDISVASNVGNGIKVNDYLIVNGGVLNVEVKGKAAKGLSSDGYMQINGGRIMILTSGDAEYDSDDNDVSGAAGIKCDSIFVMNGGVLGIKSTGAGGKGINCDDDITVNDGTIKVLTTGKQYVYNKYDTSSKGIKSDANVTVNGGTVYVRTSGGDGCEGIESKNVMSINGGTVCVSAYDDAYNASKNITVTGGKIYAYSSANDGIDSNGTINISGGVIVSVGTSVPEGGFDCDQNSFVITGGTLIGVGGGTSTPTSSQCKQPSIIYGGTGASGTSFSLNDSKGNSIMAYNVPRNYNQMTLLISSPLLKKGESYTLCSGGKITEGTGFSGMYVEAKYTGGTSLATISLNDMVASYGTTSGGMGGPGGGGPGGPGGPR